MIKHGSGKLIDVLGAKPLLLMSFLLLAACQPVVRTDVATFRADTVPLKTGTIRVVPGKDVEENLEFRHYKQRVETRLAALGYVPVTDDSAEFIARLGYSVVREEIDRPHSGRVTLGAGFYRYPRSSIYFANGGGAEYEYLREVSLAIDAAATEETADQVIQVRATSRGQCEFLTVVFDEMLDAVFANMQRGDGTVEQVAVKGDARCRQ